MFHFDLQGIRSDLFTSFCFSSSSSCPQNWFVLEFRKKSLSIVLHDVYHPMDNLLLVLKMPTDRILPVGPIHICSISFALVFSNACQSNEEVPRIHTVTTKK